MGSRVSFGRRLVLEVIPTWGQLALSVLVSFLIMFLGARETLFAKIGITSGGISSTTTTLKSQSQAVLNSALAGNLALIAFWAVVGLIAYLICWVIYGAIIAARNELTIEASYTNRGHPLGPWLTLLLKLACGVVLAAMASLLWLGVTHWPGYVETAALTPTGHHLLVAAGATVALAGQLYFVLVALQLTFTPWYREDAFTNEAI